MVDEPGERRPFGSQEIQLIEAIAAQAGAAIENARLFEAELVAREAESQRVARLSILKDVADSASSSLNVHTVAASVVGAVRRLLDAHQVQIRLVSADRTTLEIVAGAGLPRGFLDELGPMATDADVETAVCYRTGRPRLGEDVDALAVSAASRRHARDGGVRSYALLPLLARGEAIGTFYVAWGQPRRFAAEELSFLQAVAAQAATGLENARLYEAARRPRSRCATSSSAPRSCKRSPPRPPPRCRCPRSANACWPSAPGRWPRRAAPSSSSTKAHEALRAIALAGYPDDTAREVAVLPLAEPSSVSELVARDLPLVTHDSEVVGRGEHAARGPPERRRAALVRAAHQTRRRHPRRLRLFLRRPAALRRRRARAVPQHRRAAGRGLRQRPRLRPAAPHRHHPAGELHPRVAAGRRASSWASSPSRPTSPTAWAATSATSSSSTTRASPC